MEYATDAIIKEVEPSARTESIGSYEAFRDLQEPTSLDLLRNSIFRSLSNPTPIKVVDIRDISKKSSKNDFFDITKKDIDVKFLEKKCSSLETDQTKGDQKDILLTPVPSFFESRKTCTSLSDISEQISKNALESIEEPTEGLESLESSVDYSMSESLAESQDVLENNRNSLRLAFSVGSDHGIFENCSTYNLTCPHDLSLDRKLSDQRCGSDDSRRYFSTGRRSFPFLPKSIEAEENSKDSAPCTPDEQNSLCDTFFPYVVSGDYVPPQSKDSPQPNYKKQSAVNYQLKQDISPVNDFEVSINSLESESGRKSSKKIRKRNRKSMSKEPYVYECPKCGVSYTISSKTVGDVACCLHCDLCTSVEPVFMKRDKMNWRTCRIC